MGLSADRKGERAGVGREKDPGTSRPDMVAIFVGMSLAGPLKKLLALAKLGPVSPYEGTHYLG
jgi:hypothetical protein